MIIYKCVNLLNDKIYIGQTSQKFTKRVKQHKKDSLTPKTRFHRAIHKYGWDSFTWEIVESVNKNNIDNREIYYISKYKSTDKNFGYNTDTGGSGRSDVLRKLILKTPNDVAFTADCFNHFGITKSLVQQYVKSGWIVRLGAGLHRKKFNEIDVYSVLSSWLKYDNKNVHVGGRTIIEQKGMSHFIRVKECIMLYGREERLPKYMNLFDNYTYTRKSIFKSDIGIKEESYRKSNLERACIEFVLTGEINEIDLVMEGMLTLRPSVIQELLEDCKSVKAKRLFLYYGYKHKLPWVDKIDESKIDLGSGKRQIKKGGTLNKKYNIVI